MAKATQILSTKILSPLQKQELAKAGIEVIEADFIKTENKPFELKNLNESLIFTSQNAVSDRNTIIKTDSSYACARFVRN